MFELMSLTTAYEMVVLVQATVASVNAPSFATSTYLELIVWTQRRQSNKNSGKMSSIFTLKI